MNSEMVTKWRSFCEDVSEEFRKRVRMQSMGLPPEERAKFVYESMRELLHSFQHSMGMEGGSFIVEPVIRYYHLGEHHFHHCGNIHRRCTCFPPSSSSSPPHHHCNVQNNNYYQCVIKCTKE